MVSFVHEPKMHYKGGEVHAFHNVDIDHWSYFEAISLVQELSYKEEVQMWWVESEENLQNDLKKLLKDSDSIALSNHALRQNCEVHVYVEHATSKSIKFAGGLLGGKTVDQIPVEERGNDLTLGVSMIVKEHDQGVVVDHDDNSTKGIHFDDSEEDKIEDIDDKFDTQGQVVAEKLLE
ncbi:vacuolar cation/proton exchanger 5 isoform X4 [Spatholobus suberectus]|nr:vacuolar cation/proton exchanger 5 isoform X4 [Spatholobus suberectus]